MLRLIRGIPMKLLSKKQVSEKVGFSPTQIMRLVVDEEFPLPVRNSVLAKKIPLNAKLLWSEDEVEDWISNLLASKRIDVSLLASFQEELSTGPLQ